MKEAYKILCYTIQNYGVGEIMGVRVVEFCENNICPVSVFKWFCCITYKQNLLSGQAQT